MLTVLLFRIIVELDEHSLTYTSRIITNETKIDP